MNKKMTNLNFTCTTIGFIAIVFYALLWSLESNRTFFAVKIIAAAIALVAYSIRCGAEAINGEKFISTIVLIIISLYYIIVNVVLLI